MRSIYLFLNVINSPIISNCSFMNIFQQSQRYLRWTQSRMGRDSYNYFRYFQIQLLYYSIWLTYIFICYSSYISPAIFMLNWCDSVNGRFLNSSYNSHTYLFILLFYSQRKASSAWAYLMDRYPISLIWSYYVWQLSMSSSQFSYTVPCNVSLLFSNFYSSVISLALLELISFYISLMFFCYNFTASLISPIKFLIWPIYAVHFLSSQRYSLVIFSYSSISYSIFISLQKLICQNDCQIWDIYAVSDVCCLEYRVEDDFSPLLAFYLYRYKYDLSCRLLPESEGEFFASFLWACIETFNLYNQNIQNLISKLIPPATHSNI